MAVSVLGDPQDDGIERCGFHDANTGNNNNDDDNDNKKNKPNRTLLYLRTRLDLNIVSLVSIALILVVLTTHRTLSVYMTHRKWINAPITYMERTCLVPTYPTIQHQMLQQKEQPRICMTTLTDAKSPSRLQRMLRWRDFDGILELTWQNKLDYATKHGYAIYDGSHLLDTSRPPAWTKIRAVQDLLSKNKDSKPACDWVMWMDADTVIMDSSRKIQDFLPADDTHDLLVGSDNGGGYNSGVFLFRNSAWSRLFLEDWWNMDNFVRPPGFSLSGDNNALKQLLRDLGPAGFDQHVLSPARCNLNSFAKFLTLSQSQAIMNHLDEQEWYLSENFYHKGDFIAHTPGYDNKAETLRLLLSEAT